MASEIEHILNPKPLHNLHQSPVTCRVWKGSQKYEEINFLVYPFDTIEVIKQLIYVHYAKEQPDDRLLFLPKFTFVGIPEGDSFIPLEYLWYSHETNSANNTLKLADPTLLKDDLRFIKNEYSPTIRGRSIVEDVFSIEEIPILHVFPLGHLIRKNKATKISDEEWAKKFAPYFIEVSNKNTKPSEEDIKFGRIIESFIQKREDSLEILNKIIEKTNTDVKYVKVDGIQRLQLIWKKPVENFEGAASVFYSISATERRPYIRLIPSEGSSITKLHVKGALPIPTLDDPRYLEVWSNDKSVTPGIDMCIIKYVHRPLISMSQSIYGTIHVLNDGTITLLLQPPKQIRRLQPELDFRNFDRILNDVFKGLPQTIDAFTLKEMSIILKLKTTTKFNRQRILQRLPYFSYFFKEINGLPDEHKIMSLRYKAVSQYSSENELFTFITQVVTEHRIEGEFFIPQLLDSIQENFKMSATEAKNAITEWMNKKSEFTVQVPEEGEYTETNNSGIDIHLYAQHPLYYFQLHRVNNYQSYERICTLLSLLFIDDDVNFRNKSLKSFEEEEAVIVVNAEEKEERKDGPSIIIPHITQLSSEKDSLEDDLMDMFNNSPASASASASASAAASASASASASAAASASALPVKPAPAPVSVLAPVKPAVVQYKPIDLKQQKIDPQNWFITKLQQIDNELFGFKPEKGSKGYSRQCGSVDDRQPVIMTLDQYDRMRETYKDDNIFWLVYPLDKKEEPPLPDKDAETFTIMRYGSDEDHINYLFCPEFFCIHDDIMIRKTDFESATDREGNPKPTRSCPFCYGTLINKHNKLEDGATVLQRKKAENGKFPKHISFLSKTVHPKGISLPCCFIKQSTLRITSPQFTHLREYLQEKQIKKIMNTTGTSEVEDLESKEEVDEDYSELLFHADGAIDYEMRFMSVHTLSILESNKQPGPGIFAIVPSHFDEFFVQNTTASIIARQRILLKLQPYAKGFIRIGTENTPYESLLGVIAPIIKVTTIQDVQKVIDDIVKPRIFINAHFGNLVLEFYDPSDKEAMPYGYQDLGRWSQKNLSISLNSENMYELIRIFNSYTRFKNFLKDSSQRKDLRHIQPLLAEPGLFTDDGIQLIIMEDEDTNIIMKCPTFGIGARHHTNDFVFISKTKKTITSSQDTYNHYELYVYVDNIPAKGGQIAVHNTIVRWNTKSRAIWPTIVTDRINEYINACKSRYTSIYTQNSEVDPNKIIPLSYANDFTSPRFIAIIKDAYNHIIGVAFRHTLKVNTYIALPVVDDGSLSISSGLQIKHIYLNWNDFKAAPLEDVVAYYENKFQDRLKLYPGYAIQNIVRQTDTQVIVAVQLKNKIYVPVAPPKNPNTIEQLGYPIVEIEEFQWEIDKLLDGQVKTDDITNWNEILNNTIQEKRCGTDVPLEKKLDNTEFEETYQQFRYMVSNYIIQIPNVKDEIEKIIFNDDLPYYEKRKRLFLYLSNLSAWFYTDDDWEKTTSFLRKDCNLINKEENCTGTCHWKVNESKEGKCLLHVKPTSKLGGRDVNTADLFIKRVIDELIYFPNYRKQLMKKGEISRVSKIIDPIHYDDQYIIPEKSITWVNLLRLEWMKKLSDKPRYYEEMSRDGTDEIIVDKLPPKLRDILGENTELQLYVPEDQDPDKPFLSFLNVLEVPLEELKMNETTKALAPINLTRYALTTAKQIGYIDIDTDIPIMQFVRSRHDIAPMILVFVKSNNMIGLLIEQDKISDIHVSSLPSEIKWQVMKSRQKITNEFVNDKQPLLVLDKKPEHTLKQIVKTQAVNKIKRSRYVPEEPEEPVAPAPVAPAPVAPATPATPVSASAIASVVPAVAPVASAVAPVASAVASVVPAPVKRKTKYVPEDNDIPVAPVASVASVASVAPVSAAPVAPAPIKRSRYVPE